MSTKYACVQRTESVTDLAIFFAFFRVPTVRESRGIMREPGKVRENREVQEKSGNFKIPLTRPIIYALFSQFLSASGGFVPRPPLGLRPL